MKDLQHKFNELIELRDAMKVYIATELHRFAIANFPRLPKNRLLLFNLGSTVYGIRIELDKHPDNQELEGKINIPWIGSRRIEIDLNIERLMGDIKNRRSIMEDDLHIEVLALSEVIKYMDSFTKEILLRRKSTNPDGAVLIRIRNDGVIGDRTRFRSDISLNTKPNCERISNYQIALDVAMSIGCPCTVEHTINGMPIVIEKYPYHKATIRLKSGKSHIDIDYKKGRVTGGYISYDDRDRKHIITILTNLDDIFDKVCRTIAPHVYQKIEDVIQQVYLNIGDKRESIKKTISMMKLITN